MPEPVEYRELRVRIPVDLYDELYQEMRDRGCLKLGEYVRLLLNNNPFRISAKELGCSRVTDMHRAFFTLLRLTDELRDTGSFLSRVLNTADSGNLGLPAFPPDKLRKPCS